MVEVKPEALRETPAQPAEWRRALNSEFYHPDADALAFYKAETGLHDDEELKQHLLKVQSEAFAIYPYPCIRIFAFTWLRATKNPAYGHVLKLGKERENAIFIDLGCCFGNEARKLVHDGYPIQNVIASDLRKGLWDLGHRLFRSTPETYPMHFIEGDIFDPKFLDLASPVPTGTSVDTATLPSLPSLSSFNPLRGRVSAIYAGAFFHLFNFDQQYHIAKLLAGLLSPEPGSIIFGLHGGAHEKRVWKETVGKYTQCCHSPSTWTEMWHEIFSEGKGGDGGVEVQVRLKQEVGDLEYFGTFIGNKNPWYLLEWSVTRK